MGFSILCFTEVDNKELAATVKVIINLGGNDHNRHS